MGVSVSLLCVAFKEMRLSEAQVVSRELHEREKVKASFFRATCVLLVAPDNERAS